MNSTIYCGGSMVLMTRWDREVAAELTVRYDCTEWINITTMVVDLLSGPRIGEYDLTTLSYIGGGGAPLPAAVGERLEELTGADYVEGYGLTETMAQTHAVLPDRVKLQCLGVPVFDVDSRVIDPQTMEELGPNEQGEIVSSGSQVMKGYWGRPDVDREAFFERDGKRFLRTGDIGRDVRRRRLLLHRGPAQAHDQRLRLQGVAHRGREPPIRVPGRKGSLCHRRAR